MHVQPITLNDFKRAEHAIICVMPLWKKPRDSQTMTAMLDTNSKHSGPKD